MLNHTYTSVKNANLVDCGKKQHISSQPSPLLKDNFLGEFRTELDRKKVLANLGIITDVSLEWQYIKGSIESSDTLTSYIENKTTYKSILGEYKDKVVSLIKGIQQLESKINTEDELEQNQNNRLTSLEKNLGQVEKDITSLQTFLEDVEGIDFKDLQTKLDDITKNIDSITSLIAISVEDKNALTQKEDGLYVADLTEEVNKIADLSLQVQTISENYITKSELGTGPYNFVSASIFEGYTTTVDSAIKSIRSELLNTIKTGSDGNVNKLSVNTITKSTDENIKIDRALERTSNVPLDIYGVVKDLSDLYNLNPDICYAGMSVIVSSQSALYILRDPGEEGITEDYIKDSDSWKCPEDLVTQAVTIAEYEELVKLEEISDHIFYYVYEPEAQAAPNPDEYEGGKESDEYKEAYDLWLKYLGNHYMSAVWAEQIEKSLAEKVHKTQLAGIYQELNKTNELITKITGDKNELNLSGLNDSIIQNAESIKGLDATTQSIQSGISALDAKFNDYVPISTIYEKDSDKAIFATSAEFTAYVEGQAKSIATETLTTGTLTTGELVLNDTTIKYIDDQLTAGGNVVAFADNIPNIQTISADKFDPNSAEDDVYYFVHDSNVTYVDSNDFESYKQAQQGQLQAISERIGTVQNKSLAELITDLTTRVAALEQALNSYHPTTE